MKRLILAALLAGIFTMPAMAKNNGGCQGNCPGGDTTNHHNTTNQGGAGLGVGVGVGIGQGGAGGQGGSVVGSGNSSNINANTNTNRNANTNRNTNKQGQQQGQLQGQQQAAIASSRNDNRSSAHNDGNNSNQSVTVQGDNYEAPRIPVATAYAAPLAASNGTCMGSTSVGGQFVGFGVSVGSTWNDESCDMRYDAEALRLAGMPVAAVARLCQKPEIEQAMAAAGTPCPGTQSVAAAPVALDAQAIPAPQIASVQPIVTPVPPRVERYTITAAGPQRIN